MATFLRCFKGLLNFCLGLLIELLSVFTQILVHTVDQSRGLLHAYSEYSFNGLSGVIVHLTS